MPKKNFPPKVGDGRFEVQDKLGEVRWLLQDAVLSPFVASVAMDSMNCERQMKYFVGPNPSELMNSFQCFGWVIHSFQRAVVLSNYWATPASALLDNWQLESIVDTTRYNLRFPQLLPLVQDSNKRPNQNGSRPHCQGCFGAVFLGKDKKSNSPVAVKFEAHETGTESVGGYHLSAHASSAQILGYQGRRNMSC